jgi:hypothetical protein
MTALIRDDPAIVWKQACAPRFATAFFWPTSTSCRAFWHNTGHSRADPGQGYGALWHWHPHAQPSGDQVRDLSSSCEKTMFVGRPATTMLLLRTKQKSKGVGKMATEKQIAANRTNAKRSTGPKSRAGKMVSSRNAYRHGLSSPPPLDADLLAKIHTIANALVGEGAREESLKTAAAFVHANSSC